MFTKIIMRSLGRHKKKSFNFFLLLSFCSLALIFILTFQWDFRSKYVSLYIDSASGHLQILPPSSPVFSSVPQVKQEETVPLIKVSQELVDYLGSLSEIQSAAPVIQRFCTAYNMDSEKEADINLMAISAQAKSQLLPGAAIEAGDPQFSWDPSMKSVPFQRATLQTMFGEKNPDTEFFQLTEFRSSGNHWKEFKREIFTSWPALFTGVNQTQIEDDQVFLNTLSRNLRNAELYKSLPSEKLKKYDWKIDDAIFAIKNEKSPSQIPFLNKRLFSAVYPDQIVQTREPITVGKEASLQVPPLVEKGILEIPPVIPVRYTSLVSFVPLGTPLSFIDLNAFRHFLNLQTDAATAVIIRLKDINSTLPVKQKIEQWLRDHHYDYKVADYTQTGKMFVATAWAFDFITTILVVIFVIILVIFIINLALNSLQSRRKEIGTGMAIGISGQESVFLLVMETLFLVGTSWVTACFLSFFLIGAAHSWGVPGMVFFPNGVLKLDYHWGVYPLSFLLVALPTVLSTWIVVHRLSVTLPVHLLKEAV